PPPHSTLFPYTTLFRSGPEQAGDSRRLRIPLIPADQHSNVRVPGFPDAKSAGTLMVTIVGEVAVAWREVKLFVEEGIIRNVHLAVRAEQRAVCIDHRR